MDALSKNTRGLWARASTKADEAWNTKKDKEMLERRDPLNLKVDEFKSRIEEIKTRMAKHKIAREHALASLAVESDPHTSLLERFDMAYADEESRRSLCIFSKDERMRASIVERHRNMWTHYNGEPKMKPKVIPRQDARCLRTNDLRLILLRMSRNPTDFAFQVRALERLSTLAAWHPAAAQEAIEYGALRNAVAMLKETLVFVGVVIDPTRPTSPPPNSCGATVQTSRSSLSPSTQRTGSVNTSRGKSCSKEENLVASPECQNGALLVARPCLQLMATLCNTSEAAVMQMTVLEGFDLAAGALSFFPYDSTLQLAMCKLIRNRCIDRNGRMAASSNAHVSSQASTQSSASSKRKDMETPNKMDEIASRVDFSMQSWSREDGMIPDSLSILLKVMCSQLGLRTKQLTEESAEIRKLAGRYLSDKPDVVIEAQRLYPHIGDASELSRDVGEGTTSVPWSGEVKLLASIESVELVHPPDISVLCAALLAIKAFLTNHDANKEDSLEVGIIPLLLAIVRHFSHIDRITVSRRDAVSVSVLALDVLWSLIWIDSDHSTKSAINTSYVTAVQLVASGGVARLIEANSIHDDDPMVATSSQQLLQALIAALASGPSKGGGVFGFGFTNAADPQHSWHLKQCMAGSRPGLTVLVNGLKRWLGMAPLVVLIANNLSTVLNGTSHRDQGIIQSLLMALNVAEVLVPCMNFNLHDPIVTEALAKLMYCLIVCGPRGNILKNDLRRHRAGEALFKVGTVHEGVNPHVMHWAESAREMIVKRLDE